MTRLLASLMCVAVLAGGCSQSEDSFSSSFNESFKRSCIESATQGAVPAGTATKFCDCTLNKIDGKYSAFEKVRLSTDDIQPIMDECMKGLELPNG